MDGTSNGPLGFHVRFGAGDKETAGVVKPGKPPKIDIASMHDVEGSGFRRQMIENVQSCIFPSLMKIKDGMLPRRSSSVCSLIAALVDRNGAPEKPIGTSRWWKKSRA